MSHLEKFSDPNVTAKGEARARVALTHPETLWFNTGTLCNIECVNCYIDSSPTNDALVYITADEVQDYLQQLVSQDWPVREIAFTGGEPFMNPQIIEIVECSLAAGYAVLILTNAMLPIMRKRIKQGLLDLNAAYPGKLTLRISLDHFDRSNHDTERGAGAFDKTLQGMNWLRDVGIQMHVAGRTVWGDSDAASRAGYHALFENHGYDIDANDPGVTVLFPELDEAAEVPEITTACWSILDKDPNSLMCASSRMVVKRKGALRPAGCGLYAFGLCAGIRIGHQFERGGARGCAQPSALREILCARRCQLLGLGLKLCIPIQKIHPALMQMPGGEFSPKIAQLLCLWLADWLAQVQA